MNLEILVKADVDFLWKVVKEKYETNTVLVHQFDEKFSANHPMTMDLMSEIRSCVRLMGKLIKADAVCHCKTEEERAACNEDAYDAWTVIHRRVRDDYYRRRNMGTLPHDVAVQEAAQLAFTHSVN